MLYFVQTNTFCIALLIVTVYFIRVEKDALPAVRRCFIHLINAAILVCASDIFSWVFNGSRIPGGVFLNYLSNMVYYASVTLCSFIWLNYVYLQLDGLEKYHRRNKILLAIPLFVMLAVIVTTPYTKILFSVGEENIYSRESGVFLHWVISYGYLFYSTVIIGVRLKKTESKVEKKQLIPMVLFIVPPAIAAMFQLIFYGVSSTQCGITLSVVIIAFAFTKDKVSTDFLTGLNNRNAFDKYINSRITRLRFRVAVLICDIDRFRDINTAYGHVMGDIVLKRTADVLREVCAESEKPLFLCRYGSDEFLICSTEASDAELAVLTDLINRKLATGTWEHSGQFTLSVCSGTSVGMCRNATEVEALVTEAGKALKECKSSNLR